ncbi:uncharacterized protein LOC143245993 [Tachypleus tridentatus]|uniref:uncharacterized protein LOC143245993 n=1 Tax=Tachypleus tridentatus TaxID=6853 RepID=UPI003FD4F7A3
MLLFGQYNSEKHYLAVKPGSLRKDGFLEIKYRVPGEVALVVSSVESVVNTYMAMEKEYYLCYKTKIYENALNISNYHSFVVNGQEVMLQKSLSTDEEVHAFSKSNFLMFGSDEIYKYYQQRWTLSRFLMWEDSSIAPESLMKPQSFSYSYKQWIFARHPWNLKSRTLEATLQLIESTVSNSSYLFSSVGPSEHCPIQLFPTESADLSLERNMLAVTKSIRPNGMTYCMSVNFEVIEETDTDASYSLFQGGFLEDDYITETFLLEVLVGGLQ